MKHLLTALALLVTGTVVGVTIGVLVGAVPAVPAELPASTGLVLQLDWLQGLIERIDRFLEAVLDLLRTLRGLFGGEGG